jgi:hypothetical protein
MPEKGWYSLTIREETARRVREMAETRGLTVDQLINEFLTEALKGAWSTCSLCGTRIKAENMPKHMAKVHPRTT